MSIHLNIYCLFAFIFIKSIHILANFEVKLVLFYLFVRALCILITIFLSYMLPTVFPFCYLTSDFIYTV